MKQGKWFDRKFNFNVTENIFPSIIERLIGTPARLEEKLKNTAETITSTRINNSWSIKEQVGHLIDLEPLWQGRLDDFLQNRPELRPADLQNRKTEEANHNAKSLEDLLFNFRNIRMVTIAGISALDEEIIFRTSLHPRLKTPMRTMDSFIFVAEHDDHHLARISELIHILNK